MTGLGLLLLALGVADAVAGGLPGHPPVRTWAGILGGTVAAGLVATTAGTGTAAVGWALATGAVAAGWLRLRAGDRLPEVRAWAALGLLALAATAALVAGSATPARTDSPLGRVLGGLDVPALAGATPAALVLLLGAAVAMGATGNAVVRTVLVLAGPDVARSRSRLRGGRLIGPLERYLILGLALAGQPTAASLVVAAKSVLRFPELASAARRDEARDAAGGPATLDRVDAVTEYVLIGSLVSWAVALAPVALLA